MSRWEHDLGYGFRLRCRHGDGGPLDADVDSLRDFALVRRVEKSAFGLAERQDEVVAEWQYFAERTPVEWVLCKAISDLRGKWMLAAELERIARAEKAEMSAALGRMAKRLARAAKKPVARRARRKA